MNQLNTEYVAQLDGMITVPISVEWPNVSFMRFELKRLNGFELINYLIHLLLLTSNMTTNAKSSFFEIIIG